MTCIITGGNSGIGFDTARKLLHQNYDVVLACRNDERGEQAVNKLKDGQRNASVCYMNLDLASKKSIEEFVQTFNKSRKKLKLLINNAGKTFSGNTFTYLKISHSLVSSVNSDKVLRIVSRSLYFMVSRTVSTYFEYMICN